MKRRALWVGLPLLLILSLATAWSLRLTWLPWALRWGLRHLPVDRLQYEDAVWQGRTITLTQLTLQRGPHHLHIDTLHLRLAFTPSLFIHQMDYGRDTTESAPVNPIDSKIPPILTLQRWLNRLSALDTLLIRSLRGPHHTCLQVHKAGPYWNLKLDSPYGPLNLTAYQNAHLISIHASSTTLRTSQGLLSWKAVQAQFDYGDTLTLSFQLDSVGLYHPKVAAAPLKYDSIGVCLTALISDTSWHLELTPVKLPLRAQLTLRHTPPDAFYLHLEVPPQPHKMWLRAFPDGFFSVLGKAELQGQSALTLDFTYDPRLPDTLNLQIDWRPQGFGISRWSGPNPLLLREPFTYKPWRSTRQIHLGPENPNYLTYRQIHPYVLFAILHSEDGGFFYHQGFHKESFLKAMLENWRCRCFRRGAGTITMQLVRNLLLTRQKTIARKVEEILLTALIERFRLLSKERMLELYFNMVEWGPEIYGLTEAAQFYFAKSPYDLSLSEAIFLSLILPSPRAYRYYIDDSTQCARASLAPAYEKIGYYVTRANYLPAESLATISPGHACLRGPARRIFLPPDSLNELSE